MLRKFGGSALSPASPELKMKTPFAVLTKTWLLSPVTPMPPMRCPKLHSEPSCVRVPSAATAKPSSVAPLAYKNRPSLLSASEMPEKPDQRWNVKGEPGVASSTPLSGSTANAEIEPEPSFAAKSRLREGATTMRCANSAPETGASPTPPVANGEPDTLLVCPSAPM